MDEGAVDAGDATVEADRNVHAGLAVIEHLSKGSVTDTLDYSSIGLEQQDRAAHLIAGHINDISGALNHHQVVIVVVRQLLGLIVPGVVDISQLVWLQWICVEVLGE